MTDAGHVLIGTQGEMLSVDRGFCALMQTDAAAIVGRLVLDVTAPPDRAECALAIGMLRETLQPFSISKRFIREDGTMLWVTNTVSITSPGAAPQTIVATIVPIDDPAQYRSPARLLECAQLLLESRIDRSLAFDHTLFSDPAWAMLLAAYIAEAEGKAVDCASFAVSAGMTLPVSRRWLRLLVERDLIEMEAGTPLDGHTAFCLTADGHARFESHLGGLAVKHRGLLGAA